MTLSSLLEVWYYCHNFNSFLPRHPGAARLACPPDCTRHTWPLNRTFRSPLTLIYWIFTMNFTVLYLMHFYHNMYVFIYTPRPTPPRPPTGRVLDPGPFYLCLFANCSLITKIKKLKNFPAESEIFVTSVYKHKSNWIFISCKRRGRPQWNVLRGNIRHPRHFQWSIRRTLVCIKTS